jgi:hypothetical protein
VTWSPLFLAAGSLGCGVARAAVRSLELESAAAGQLISFMSHQQQFCSLPTLAVPPPGCQHGGLPHLDPLSQLAAMQLAAAVCSVVFQQLSSRPFRWQLGP